MSSVAVFAAVFLALLADRIVWALVGYWQMRRQMKAYNEMLKSVYAQPIADELQKPNIMQRAMLSSAPLDEDVVDDIDVAARTTVN